MSLYHTTPRREQTGSGLAPSRQYRERPAAHEAVVGRPIDGTGTLLVLVTKVGDESFLRRVAREVEDTRALNPRILHLVDRNDAPALAEAQVGIAMGTAPTWPWRAAAHHAREG